MFVLRLDILKYRAFLLLATFILQNGQKCAIFVI